MPLTTRDGSVAGGDCAPSERTNFPSQLADGSLDSTAWRLRSRSPTVNPDLNVVEWDGAPSTPTLTWPQSSFTGFAGYAQHTGGAPAGGLYDSQPLGFSTFTSGSGSQMYSFAVTPGTAAGGANLPSETVQPSLELRLLNRMRRTITGIEVRFLAQGIEGLSSTAGTGSYETTRLTAAWAEHGHVATTVAGTDATWHEWSGEKEYVDFRGTTPAFDHTVAGENIAAADYPSARYALSNANDDVWSIPSNNNKFRKLVASDVEWREGDPLYLRFAWDCPTCGLDCDTAPCTTKRGVPVRMPVFEIIPFVAQSGDYSWEIWQAPENVIDIRKGWMQTDPVTIQMWLRPDPYDPTVRFPQVDQGNTAEFDMPPLIRTETRYPIVCGFNNVVANVFQYRACWMLVFDATNQRFNIRYWSEDVPAGPTTLTTDITLKYNVKPNRWFHLTIYQNYQDASIYIDGKPDQLNVNLPGTGVGTWGNDQFGQVPSDATGYIRIGQDLADSNNDVFYRGLIDEFRVWYGDRTEEELVDDASLTLQGDLLAEAQHAIVAGNRTSSLLLYLDFNDNSDIKQATAVVGATDADMSLFASIQEASVLTTPYSPHTPMARSSLNGGYISCTDKYVPAGGEILCTGYIKDSAGYNVSRLDYSWIDDMYFQPYVVYGPGQVSPWVRFDEANPYIFQFTYFADSHKTGSARIGVRAAGTPFGADPWHIRTVGAGCRACEYMETVGADKFYRCEVGGRYFLRKNVHDWDANGCGASGQGWADTAP